MSSAWSSSLRTHSCHARPPYDPPVAYDEVLAERIRTLLPGDAAVSERAMFGGLAFLVGGHMAVAASGQGGLLVRVDPAGSDELLSTGGAVPMEMGGRPIPFALENTCAVLDGADRELLDWITRSDLAVLIADNYAVEAHPAGRTYAGCCAVVPLHEHCLFKLGIHLGELWHLTALAAWLREHGRNRFLLTAPPLRLPGAVGSPLTPVATV